MFAQTTSSGRLDRWAIGLSGLCLAHCLGTAIIVTLVSSVGGILLHPAIHEVGLAIAILFGALALGKGALTHGYLLPVAVGSLGLGMMGGALTMDHGTTEMIYTILGVLLVALGHDLNRRAVA